MKHTNWVSRVVGVNYVADYLNRYAVDDFLLQCIKPFVAANGENVCLIVYLSTNKDNENE